MAQNHGWDGTSTLVVVRDTGGGVAAAMRALDGLVPPDDRLVVWGAPRGKRSTVEHVEDLEQLATIVADHAATGAPLLVLDGTAHGLVPRWWRALLAATEHHGAVVPTTNAGPWPNAPLDLPGDGTPINDWRRWAIGLADRPCTTIEADHVDGTEACAVALSAGAALRLVADGIGALEPRALARATGRAGVGLARADGVYVHDDAATVLLSACIIMKDEEDNVGRCLTSLTGVVDEIIIHDTGSTDRSIELARAMGATVIEGAWDDDFATARNIARRACRGRWLLHIDLDEVIEDPAAARGARAKLAADTSTDVYEPALFNLSGTELAPTRLNTAFRPPRLVRRATCEWSGAIHEEPVRIGGESRTRNAPIEGFAILHYGYLAEVMKRRDKAERNTRIAEQRDDGASDARRSFEKARAYVLSGRTDDAVAAYAVTAAAEDEPILRRVSMEHAATVLLAAERLDEAATWIERRAAIPDVPGVARWLRAHLALQQGRHADVLTELDGITAYADLFSAKGPDSVHVMRAKALTELGRMDEAAEEVVATLEHNPQNDDGWVLLLAHSHEWGDALARAARSVPASEIKLLSGKLLRLEPSVASVVAEHLWEVHPDSLVLLALASRIAPRLDLGDAARWAVRLRAAGLAAQCPLRTIADDDGAPTVLRLQAAYLGAELFDDIHLAARQRELTTALATA